MRNIVIERLVSMAMYHLDWSRGAEHAKVSLEDQQEKYRVELDRLSDDQLLDQLLDQVKTESKNERR